MTALVDLELTHPTAEGEHPVSAFHHLLEDLRGQVAEQGRMIELLDRRREELEELVVDMLPVANAGMSMAIRALDRIQHAGLLDRGRDAVARLDAARRAPAPSLLHLWRRARTQEARRGFAVALEALALLGQDHPLNVPPTPDESHT